MAIKLINSFTIGADPEFVALDKEGDIVNVMGILDSEGPVGWDHGGRVVEVRPHPAKGCWALLKHIRGLLVDSPKAELLAKHSTKWRGGGHYQPPRKGAHSVQLGGHIHFSLPPEGEEHTKRVAALDRFFRVLEALGILPAEEMKKRRDGMYGGYGNVRNKDEQYRPYDGHSLQGYHYGRWEYRTPPSWLFGPKIALLCLTGAKLAVCSPSATLEALPDKATFDQLRAFFDAARAKDTNAARVYDRLLKGKSMVASDVDADIRQAWSSLKEID